MTNIEGSYVAPFYQIQDKQGNVLIKFGTLIQCRIASVDMKQGTQIVERTFVDGEWEEVVLYERA